MFKFLLSKLAGTTVPTEVTETVTDVVTDAGKVAELGFTTANLSEALLWFVTGMVGIFMVIGIIIVVVSLLNKFGAGKKK